MEYKIEPTSYPLYGGHYIAITLTERTHLEEGTKEKAESTDEISQETKAITTTKMASFSHSSKSRKSDASSGHTSIDLSHVPVKTQSENNLTVHRPIESTGSVFSKQMTDNNDPNEEISYFLVFEGSTIVHVVSSQLRPNNMLYSIIPQHNNNEKISISLYKAYRNMKAERFGDYYREICELPGVKSFDYANDEITTIANRVVESLHDLNQCYEILSVFINTALAVVGSSPDCTLNIENRLNYLIRFYIDVQYSLGFLVVLNSDGINMNQFHQQKSFLLSFLKDIQFYALHKLFTKIYTLGPNNELNMRVEILPNEPSFLYFAYSDTKDNNFIREYTNSLVSHSTCKENNFLNIKQKISIITNIFMLPSLSHQPNNNGAINTNTLQLNQGVNKKTSGINNKLALFEMDRVKAAKYGGTPGNITNSVDEQSTSKTFTNLTIDDETSALGEGNLISVSTSYANLPANDESNSPEFSLKKSYHKANEISKANKKLNYVTIKSSHITTRKDPSLQVDKAKLQKFFSTKYSKGEAELVHQRFGKINNESLSNDVSGGNSSCKSNQFLKEFLLQTCSTTSANSNDRTHTSQLMENSDVNSTSHSLTNLACNQAAGLGEDDSDDSSVLQLKTAVNCRSSIIFNDIEIEDKKGKNLQSTTSYGGGKGKTKQKAQSQISNKLSHKNKSYTFGHKAKFQAKLEADSVNIRAFLDKEITHLDNDTSFKNSVQFKPPQTKQKYKNHLGFGLFKKDKVHSDMTSTTTHEEKSKSKSKEKGSSSVKDRSNSSKSRNITSIKKFNTSDAVPTPEDTFNRSINCLFDDNEMDLQTNDTDPTLFNTDTWSDMVDPKVIKKLGAKETKRQDVIYELIYTENQYIRTLKTLYHVMYKGLKNFLMINASTVDSLMPNLASLIAVNGRFLADLRARQNAGENYMVQNIADVFNSQFSTTVGSYMAEIYAQVCLQKCTAVELYKDLMKTNPDFEQFVSACANRPQLKRLTIPEVIAFITQRPLKYPILIKEILKCTKEDTPEHENLTKALENAKKVIQLMNSLVTEYENAATFDKIRKKLDTKLEYLYEDSLLKFDDIFPRTAKLVESQHVVFKTKQRSYDVILVALKTHFVFLIEKDSKYTLLSGSENPPIIPMQNLLLRTVATDKKAFFLVDKYHAHMYEIVCPNVLEKSNWVNIINGHLKENAAGSKFIYKKT